MMPVAPYSMVFTKHRDAFRKLLGVLHIPDSAAKLSGAMMLLVV
jgi:hypothetical protein